jgi:hypothetical protein
MKHYIRKGDKVYFRTPATIMGVSDEGLTYSMDLSGEDEGLAVKVDGAWHECMSDEDGFYWED